MHPIRARVQRDGCLGERIDIDGTHRRAESRGDDAHESAASREVKDRASGDLVRVVDKPA
jgi:hypothetical protein